MSAHTVYLMSTEQTANIGDHPDSAARIRSGLWLPLFDELADPRTVQSVAEAAESAGWDGVFVWDHIAWGAPDRAVADPWITLAAIATATEHVAIGPMVTPLGRRRPVKVAREAVTLDRLAGNRLILGAGLGSDRFADEYRRTGEATDSVVRAAMLDESLEILDAALSGQQVRHHGPHYRVDDLTFVPEPLQRRVPIWIAVAAAANPRPMRRAARHDGLFPVNLDSPDQLAEITATVTAIRQPDNRPFDIVVGLPPDADPAPYRAAGATWALTEFDPASVRLDTIMGVARGGPSGSDRA